MSLMCLKMTRTHPTGFTPGLWVLPPVGTHEHGELYSHSRRITLVLDIRSAYQRLKRRGNWIFRFLTDDWDDQLHKELAA